MADGVPFNPNPTYGEISLFEKLLLKLGLPLYLLGVTIPKVLFRRILSLGPSAIPLSEDLTRDIGRTVITLFNTRQLRTLHGTGDAAASKTLSTPRFSAVKHNLYQHVVHPSMSGYWIFRNSYTHPTAPTSSTIVLYYLHGGGYCFFQPGHMLIFLLRLADKLTSLGHRVSIFALDYSLAPEHVFPAQLAQAASAYSYLITDLHIPPEKIVLLGDSAGGSLALSLCNHLCTPHPSLPPLSLPKPKAAFLISPWISMTTTHNTYTDFALYDTLTARALENWTCFFRGPETPADDPVLLQYSRFSDYSALPDYTYILAGGSEMFAGDIVEFAEAARSEGGRRVELSLIEAGVHDVPAMECIASEQTKVYCGIPLEEVVGDEVLGATTKVAVAVAGYFKKGGKGGV